RMFLLLFLPPSFISSTAIPQLHPLGESTQRINRVNGPLTAHFASWLEDNGYGSDDFLRLDYGDQGSYGGKTSDDQEISFTPVVFIHGNSDSALTAGYYQGWTNTIQYFIDKGWNSASLYATSWGDDNGLNAELRTHNCETTQRLRRFLIAVQNYTKSDKIHVIGHSMGVTLGRKIILGGKITASDGNCDLGAPLRFIDVFVGLAGANYGLCHCIVDSDHPTCNHDNGYWPGDYCGDNAADQCGAAVLQYPCNGVKYSTFLNDLNSDFDQLAKRVVSAWSSVDDLIQYGDNIWGHPTSLIVRSNDKKIYPNYTHMETKESPESVRDQYEWINRIK
ncbi:hypothetical protein PFISCL1PPCAC_1723, partial [Pristionchus fissidentatus]